jgi:hypothetical protein
MIDLISALQPSIPPTLLAGPSRRGVTSFGRVTGAIIRLPPTSLLNLALIISAASGAALFIAATYALGSNA